MILHSEDVKAVVGEHAAVRNADEEEPLFDRQMQQARAPDVLRVEAPHASLREHRIPRDEEPHHQRDPREQSPPPFMEPDPWMEARQKGHQHAAQVYPGIRAHGTPFMFQALPLVPLPFSLSRGEGVDGT